MTASNLSCKSSLLKRGRPFSSCSLSVQSIIYVYRDNAEFRSEISPDSKPARFTNRVFRSMQAKKAYCWTAGMVCLWKHARNVAKQSIAERVPSSALENS